MTDSNSKKVAKNFLWRFLERSGAQGVTFVVSIVLARLLDPDAYGLIALVTVFTSILQVFVDGGLGNALIQKKDADDLDFSSVFFTNIAMCALLYALMFFAAPLIADFYNKPELVSVIRVLSLTLIISGVKNIQQAYVSRNLLFKRFFFATLGGTIGAALLGIWLAYSGFGVWALVTQHLFNATVDTMILWITVKWRPKKCFSIKRLKGLYRFGWKLLVSSLLDTLFINLRQLIIGKKYTAADLAFYNKGQTLPNIFVSNINTSIDSVLLPVMSKKQDNTEIIKQMTRRAIKTSTFLMMPFMFGLSACAVPLVRLMLTEKWMACVPFLYVFCFTHAFYPIQTANLNAINAMGRSDVFLKLEIIKKVIGLLIILITMWISPFAMAIGMAATSILCQIVNSWPNKGLLNYNYFDQLRDIAPSFLLAGGMSAIVFAVQLLKLNDWLTLLIQIPLGCFLYIFLSRAVKLESYQYVANTLRAFFRNSSKTNDDNK